MTIAINGAQAECDGCLYFAGSDVGYCHYYPQTLAKNHSDWCSRFKPGQKARLISEIRTKAFEAGVRAGASNK